MVDQGEVPKAPTGSGVPTPGGSGSAQQQGQSGPALKQKKEEPSAGKKPTTTQKGKQTPKETMSMKPVKLQPLTLAGIVDEAQRLMLDVSGLGPSELFTANGLGKRVKKLNAKIVALKKAEPGLLTDAELMGELKDRGLLSEGYVDVLDGFETVLKDLMNAKYDKELSEDLKEKCKDVTKYLAALASVLGAQAVNDVYMPSITTLFPEVCGSAKVPGPAQEFFNAETLEEHANKAKKCFEIIRDKMEQEAAGQIKPGIVIKDETSPFWRRFWPWHNKCLFTSKEDKNLESLRKELNTHNPRPHSTPDEISSEDVKKIMGLKENQGMALSYEGELYYVERAKKGGKLDVYSKTAFDMKASLEKNRGYIETVKRKAQMEEVHSGAINDYAYACEKYGAYAEMVADYEDVENRKKTVDEVRNKLEKWKSTAESNLKEAVKKQEEKAAKLAESLGMKAEPLLAKKKGRKVSGAESSTLKAEVDQYNAEVKMYNAEIELYKAGIELYKSINTKNEEGKRKRMEDAGKELEDKADDVMEVLTDEIITPYYQLSNKEASYWISAFYNWASMCDLAVNAWPKNLENWKRKNVVMERSQTAIEKGTSADWVKPITTPTPEEIPPVDIMSEVSKGEISEDKLNALPANVNNAIGVLNQNNEGYSLNKKELLEEDKRVLRLYRTWMWFQGVLKNAAKSEWLLTENQCLMLKRLTGLDTRGLDPSTGDVIDEATRNQKVTDIEREIGNEYYQALAAREETREKLNAYNAQATTRWDAYRKYDDISKLKNSAEAQKEIRGLTQTLVNNGCLTEKEGKEAEDKWADAQILSDYAKDMSRQMLKEIGKFSPRMPLEPSFRCGLKTVYSESNLLNGEKATKIYNGPYLSYHLRDGTVYVYGGFSGSVESAGGNIEGIKLNSSFVDVRVEPPTDYHMPPNVPELLKKAYGYTKAFEFKANFTPQYEQQTYDIEGRRMGRGSDKISDGLKFVIEEPKLTVQNIEQNTTLGAVKAVLSAPLLVYEKHPTPATTGHGIGGVLDLGVGWSEGKMQRIAQEGLFYEWMYGGGQRAYVYATHECDPTFKEKGNNVGVKFNAWPIGGLLGGKEVNGSVNIFRGERAGKQVNEITGSIDVDITSPVTSVFGTVGRKLSGLFSRNEE